MVTEPTSSPNRSLAGGRYVLGEALASGGMATVHIARQTSPLGHSRVVAIKRLRHEYARDPEFVAMLLDEARLTARVRHANVVPLLDVVAEDGELMLVLEYVAGVPLSWLAASARETREPLPTPVVVAVALDVLEGLDAIHGARDDRGNPLRIVHRDVSPQNVMVGADGVSRLLDLGVAKASRRAQTTRGGELKGKLCYMAPEQLELKPVDVRADLYSTAVLLWELCAGRRLHDQSCAAELLDSLARPPVPLSELRPVDDPTRAVERELVRALSFDAKERHANALELARALDAACRPATRWEVRDRVQQLGRSILDERAELTRRVERDAEPLTGRVGPAASFREAETIRGDPNESETAMTTAVRRGGRVTPRTALGALLLAALAFGLLARPHASSAPPPAVAQRPFAPSVVPLQTAAPARSAAPAQSAAPAEQTESAPLPARHRVAPAAPSTTHPAKPAASSAPPPISPCNPPYRIDASGVRVYKEECI